MILNAKTSAIGKHFEYFEQINSTNTYLKENADKYAHGSVVAAKTQINGRGRLGRNWLDLGDKNLSASILLKNMPTQNLTILPLVTGVCVARALSKVCGVEPTLKWSNDVILADKKVCGVLCESVVHGDVSDVIVGIGLNIAQTAQDFENLNLVYATSLLCVTGKIYDNTTILAAICEEFERILSELENVGINQIMPEYKRISATLNREVKVTVNGDERVGKAKDIADDGALVCDIDGESVTINAGIASVRGLFGYV